MKRPNLLADVFAREMNGMRAHANRRLAVHDLTLDENDNIVPIQISAEALQAMSDASADDELDLPAVGRATFRRAAPTPPKSGE